MESGYKRPIIIILSYILLSNATTVMDLDSVCNTQDFIKKINSDSIPKDTWMERNRYGGTCKFDSSCICLENGDKITMHCDGLLEARSVFLLPPIDTTNLNIQCNETMSSNSMEKNFYSNLKLFNSSSISAWFFDCPEPLRNYSSAIYSKTEDDQIVPVIRSIFLKCRNRKTFSVSSQYFLGLNKLKSLTISCSVVSYLPKDLFDGMRNVELIEIVHTLVDSIPKELFSGLTYLRRLILNNNRIKYIAKDSFLGLGGLNYLDLESNSLTHLDDSIFVDTLNIYELLLNNNSISNMPKSFFFLKNLEILRFDDNSLRSIEINTCQRHLESDDLNQHFGTKSIWKESCFPSLPRLKNIDLSGNRIDKIPYLITNLPNLENLKFSHNSGLLTNLHGFLVGESLTSLEISNSSIMSVDPNFLHGFPALVTVDFSMNRITTLHEEFFIHNSKLETVNFHTNELMALPSRLFFNNRNLQHVIISFNRIKQLDPSFLAYNKMLQYLDLSDNLLMELQSNFLQKAHLYYFNISSNKLANFDGALFKYCTFLEYIDISDNNLDKIEKESFSNLTSLVHLNISKNNISSIGGDFLKNTKSLKVLDLSYNLLTEFPFQDVFARDRLNSSISPIPIEKDSLRELILDGNLLTKVNITSLNYIEKLHLSKNKLSEVIFPPTANLRRLSLSYNPIKSLQLPWSTKVIPMEIDLSYCKISFCETTISLHPFLLWITKKFRKEPFLTWTLERFPNYYCPYRSLDFSSNNISFSSSPSDIDSETMLWGKKTELEDCDTLEVLDFRNNSIEDVLLDWRIGRSLKLVDLRVNKIKFLKEQDILFRKIGKYESSCQIKSDEGILHCKSNLTVDLRDNEITGVELPSWHLVKVPSGCNRTMNHSHATILLDDNPFFCGLGTLNFLRYIEEDVTLLTEVLRRTGKNKAQPAKILPGNLTCMTPELVRGKKVMETETYVHQLIPMVGLCALMGCSFPEDLG